MYPERGEFGVGIVPAAMANAQQSPGIDVSPRRSSNPSGHEEMECLTPPVHPTFALSRIKNDFWLICIDYDYFSSLYCLPLHKQSPAQVAERQTR